MLAPIALTGIMLDTPLLDETATFYVDSFGLSECVRAPSMVSLRAVASLRPAVVLRRAAQARLSAIHFAMRDAVVLAELHATLTAAGCAPSAMTLDTFAVCDPDGTSITLHVGEDASRHRETATDRPLFMSHLVLNSRNPERLIAFYRDRIGLRISDRYEKGLLVFMRCDQPQHHCLGISPGSSDGLNHFAMDCGHIDAVMRGVSRMRQLAHQPLWGPGRHGPGGNVFCYFEDPTGFVPEFTCDVLQIDDDASWMSKEWQRTPENGNVWLSGPPSPRAVALMNGDDFPNPAAQSVSQITE
jgi:catechol 2,3-dioxygenase-like lactoylglutathione lyase family enzyme